MIIVLNKTEVADDRAMQFANLVVRKQGKTYRVLKNRYGRRKVLREEEILNFEANNQTK